MISNVIRKRLSFLTYRGRETFFLNTFFPFWTTFPFIFVRKLNNSKKVSLFIEINVNFAEIMRYISPILKGTMNMPPYTWT